MTEPAADHPQDWEDVYRRLYPRLFAFARRRVASDDDADDAVAEAMARAVAADGRVGPGSADVDGWVFGICRNVLHERFRAGARDARWIERGAELVDLSGDGPLDEVLAAEQRSRLVAAFARLDRRDRDLLELRVVAELGTDQLSAVLGKRPGAIRMAQSRALARLRTLMEEVT